MTDNQTDPLTFEDTTTSSGSRLSPTDFDIVNSRIDGTNQRHAELAALVSKLTVAVEALEAKVEDLLHPPPPAPKPYWSKPSSMSASDNERAAGA